ncbi:MAG TPA: ankyrin repeat domain-containing protein [Bryobacteraceae bacterium]|nr:ankyrin repeat domain-containing protein [Bryobacteraceae bacterium]
MTAIRVFGTSALIALSISAAYAAAAASDVADAAMNRNREAIKASLQKKADVNAPQSDGTTALHWAVRNDDLDMAAQLIKAGANPKAANRDGATPLYLACENGSQPMIELLLKTGVDVNEPFLLHSETALMVASRTGNVKVVDLLLVKGANVNARETLRQTTALMWAAEQNHPEVIRTLVAHGADVNAQSKVITASAQYGLNAKVKTDGSIGGVTSLVLASREGGLDSVRILTEAKADLNKTSADGSSAMVVAIQNGHYDVATYLATHGANPDLQNDKGWNALYLAVKNRNLETGTIPVPNQEQAMPFIQLLLDKGANPNLRLKANTEIRNGQRATWMNEPGATPFLRASMCGDIETMRLLLAHGADPLINTDDHTTPLMAVAGVGYTDGFIHDRSEEETMAALKFLVEEIKVPINAANDGGLTALHGAAHKAALYEIQYLVDHGADLSAKDHGAKAYGANTPGLLPYNWAEGVVIGVQSAIYHPEAVELITKLMKERNIPLPEAIGNRTLGGNAKAVKN